MAYIRVPTGVKNVTVTASKRTFFYFRCASCGKEALVPFKVTGTAQGSYHVLNSSEKKEAVANEARQNSQAALSGADAELFNGVNVKKDYSVVKKAIKCPYCNKKQPWSLLRDLIHTPFIVPFVGTLLFSIVMLFRHVHLPADAGRFRSVLPVALPVPQPEEGGKVAERPVLRAARLLQRGQPEGADQLPRRRPAGGADAAATVTPLKSIRQRFPASLKKGLLQIPEQEMQQP